MKTRDKSRDVPAATAPLPAIRYTSFIEAFEKAVHEAQQAVKRLEAGQAEYLACVEAIRTVPIPNEGRLTLVENGAAIQLTAIPIDSKVTFDRLVNAIGAELVARNLHPDGIPSVQMECLWAPELRYTFWTQRPQGGNGYIRVNVRIPDAGILDLAVVEQKRVSNDIVYVIMERSKLIDGRPAPDLTTPAY